MLSEVYTSTVGAAGYTQLGEVVHFYVFGYIVLACLDRLAAEASGTVCVLL